MHTEILPDRMAQRLRSQFVRLSTGPELHYVEQGDPHGEPVIFVHGWPDSWFSYSLVLAALPASYHAFALDLRGFGDSERPAAGYSIDSLAADIAAFQDAAGIGPATLVGHSMGSFIVRRVAALFPEQVSRLVLIGSDVSPLNAVTREVHDLAQALEDPISHQFVREFQTSTIHAPVPGTFFEGLVSESLKAPARVWQSALDGLLGLNDLADLGQIAAPTLILWGAHDGLFTSIHKQHCLAAAIPGAQLTIYPDAGHSPNWEFPERIANDLTMFMQQTAQRIGRPSRDEETSR